MHSKPRPIRVRVHKDAKMHMRVNLRTQRHLAEKKASEREDVLRASTLARLGNAVLEKRGIKLNPVELRAFHSAIAENILMQPVDFISARGEYIPSLRREKLTQYERNIVNNDTRIMKLLLKLRELNKLKRSRTAKSLHPNESRRRVTKLRTQCKLALDDLIEVSGFADRQREGELVSWQKKWRHLLNQPRNKAYFSEWVRMEITAHPQRYHSRVQKIIGRIFPS
ncbi:MAG: hypothetical protein FJY86_01760 [Candidatus Diapherotrites archaeon]|uniref:Uncharacterized protein n=1 Tax=Candidatus Iainarchaeum sp. TaxID=3101447 RepID=A0A8T4C7Y9_9ARCH|nr:hypothetical protein [Candidatus Diapherotrites archaeon]